MRCEIDLEEMYCSKCGSKNPDSANFCTKCGNRLSQLPDNPQNITTNTMNNNIPENQTTEQTNTNQCTNKKANIIEGIIGGLMGYYVVVPEIIILSIIFGILLKSWLVFGLILIGSFIVYGIPKIAWILVILLSLMWGVIGYSIGAIFSSISGEIVLGLIGFILGLGVHVSVIDFYNLFK